MEEAKKYNEAQRAKYEKSAFGGVDIWFILGLAVFVVPLPALVLLVLLFTVVDHKGPPVHSCDGVGVSKLPSGDGAQESAIEVEQSQPGALGMAITSQHDHLVAVHCDVAAGTLIIIIKNRSGSNRGLDCGDDLQM